MADPLFTRDEARALLPQLRPLLERIVALQGLLADRQSLRAVRRVAGRNGGGETARRMLAGVEELNAAVAAVEALGVVLRDPVTGLVDFPAEREGAPVFLCWRLGEDDVGHWHDRDSGFMGRRPL